MKFWQKPFVRTAIRSGRAVPNWIAMRAQTGGEFEELMRQYEETVTHRPLEQQPVKIGRD